MSFDPKTPATPKVVVHHVFHHYSSPRRTYREPHPVVVHYAAMWNCMLFLLRVLCTILVFLFVFGRALYGAARNRAKKIALPVVEKTRPYGVGSRAPFGKLAT
jgi:hypothetical protein